MSNDHGAELMPTSLCMCVCMREGSTCVCVCSHTHTSEGTMHCCLLTLFLPIDFPLVVVFNICLEKMGEFDCVCMCVLSSSVAEGQPCIRMCRHVKGT